jgi:hypothetical protein
MDCHGSEDLWSVCDKAGVNWWRNLKMRRLLEFLIFSAVLGFAPNSLAGSVDCEALKQGTVPFEIVGRNADTRVTTPRMIMQVIPGQGRQTVWRVLEQTEYESIDGPVTKRTSVAVIKSILQNSFATDIEGRKIKDVTSKFQESKSTNTYDGLDLVSVDPTQAASYRIRTTTEGRKPTARDIQVSREPIGVRETRLGDCTFKGVVLLTHVKNPENGTSLDTPIVFYPELGVILSDNFDGQIFSSMEFVSFDHVPSHFPSADAK